MGLVARAAESGTSGPAAITALLVLVAASGCWRPLKESPTGGAGNRDAGADAGADAYDAPAETPRAACSIDAECKPDELCLSGACFKADCRSDGDCKPGKVCSGYRCLCPRGLTDCAGECRDLTSDAHSCGTCTNACRDDERCVEAVCKRVECVGAGDAECSDSRTCVDGICRCKSTFTTCFTQCVDVKRDPWNCGACGHVCWKSESCVDGACIDSGQCLTEGECPQGFKCLLGACACPDPLGVCGDKQCVDVMTDSRYCFNCSTECKLGNACEMGMCVAKQKCTSSSECKKGHTCSSGLCSCATGTIDCGASGCADFASDAENCGACGIVCSDPPLCNNGRCVRKKGGVLEVLPLPPPGEPLVGLTAVTNHTFWANRLSGEIFKFDVLLNSSFAFVESPDISKTTSPHGIARIGFVLFMGLYKTGSLEGPSGEESLGRIGFPSYGGFIPGFTDVTPKLGGSLAPVGDKELYVFSNSSRTLRLIDAGTLATKSTAAVTGFATSEVVWDTAWDGTAVWAVGLRYSAGMPAGSFVRTIDPGSGKVTADLAPPDPAWVTAIAYDGGNIWMAGKSALYRCQR